MKNVLCFGDSNTYGVNPVDGNRFGRMERWPGILQNLLGEEYHVIEEGLGGRTTVWDDPLADHRNGIEALEMLLDSHAPLDEIVLMLGTNDLKYHFSAIPEDIASGMEKIIVMILHHIYGEKGHAPHILLMSPIALGEGVEHSKYSGFRKEAVRYSKMLPVLYQDIAERYGCGFLEAGIVAQPDKADWIHMNAVSHRKLAEKIAEYMEDEIENRG